MFDEAAAEPGAELDLLRLAMTLAHNRGDLAQGIGFWKRTPLIASVMNHLSERGRFSLAVRVYQHTGLSAEGHRHYPLRAANARCAARRPNCYRCAHFWTNRAAWWRNLKRATKCWRPW